MTDSHTTPTTAVPAGLFRRLAAIVYDSMLLLGLSFAYAGMFAVSIPNWLGEPMALGDVAYEGWSRVLFQLGWLALLAGFFVYFWRRGGQTLGMRAWRLRVQAVGGGQPSYGQCLLRCLLAAVSMAAFGLGYIWCVVDPKGQTVHDRLTNTETVMLPKEEH